MIHGGDSRVQFANLSHGLSLGLKYMYFVINSRGSARAGADSYIDPMSQHEVSFIKNHTEYGKSIRSAIE